MSFLHHFLSVLSSDLACKLQLLGPTLFTVDEGRYPHAKTLATFPTNTHSLAHQKTRDAGIVMPPGGARRKGVPSILLEKRTPHAFRGATAL